MASVLALLSSKSLPEAESSHKFYARNRRLSSDIRSDRIAPRAVLTIQHPSKKKASLRLASGLPHRLRVKP
jgi:hypothetical protein